MRSVSNTLISKSLIYFSYRVDIDINLKKIRKNQNYLNKKTKNTKVKKINKQNNFELLIQQVYSITYTPPPQHYPLQKWRTN